MLLTTEGSNSYPVWSHDGEWVFSASDRGGNLDIWKRRADQSLDAVLVLDTEAPVVPFSISADGQRLLFRSGDTVSPDIGILALDADSAEPEMLVATPANEGAADFSPDGRYFAFSSNQTRRFEVYVMEIESRRIFQVSTSARGGVSLRLCPCRTSVALASSRIIVHLITDFHAKMLW